MDEHQGAALGIEGIEDAVRVGQGSYGVVYQATQPAYRRTVAVKMLSVPLMDDQSRRRFDRECQALGSLSNHPNIVTLHAAGVTRDGHPYLIMEFLAGGSLAARMASRGPLSWEETTSIGVKLAGALAAAHAHGVLHRDIKPENVLVSGYGEPQLADFGVARIQDGTTGTTTGTVTGSLAHAAPEILSGLSASEASDIWSLASTLATLMAGHSPFHRDGEASLYPLMARIMNAPPEDLRLIGVPDPLCALIESALAKDSWERPQRADDFGRSLQEVQAGLGLAVTPLPTPTSPSPVTPVATSLPATPIVTGGPAFADPSPDVANPPPDVADPSPAFAEPAPVVEPSPAFVQPAPAFVEPPPDPATATRRRAPIAPSDPPAHPATPTPAPRQPRLVRRAASKEEAAAHALPAEQAERLRPGLAQTQAGRQAGATPDPVRPPTGPPVQAKPEKPATAPVAPVGPARADRPASSSARLPASLTRRPMLLAGGVVLAVVLIAVAVLATGHGSSSHTTTGTTSPVSSASTQSTSTPSSTSPPLPLKPAFFNDPVAVRFDSAGALYIVEFGGNRIRKISLNGTMTTVAGTGQVGSTGDGGPATAATLNGPIDLAVANGIEYVGEFGGNRVRKISPTGIITTVAGTGQPGSTGDGGPATAATLAGPTGLAIDAHDNLYVAEGQGNRIRKISTNGTITTVAGDGQKGSTGDGGPATGARLNAPAGLAVDSSGTLFIVDVGGNRVRRVSPDGIITTVAGTGVAGSTGDGGPATAATLSRPTGVALDVSGNLYVAEYCSDSTCGRVRKVSVDGTIGTVGAAA